ncbi:hypothetical protein HYC85_007784 [Camellia sinensis]|uniref:BPL/LPL catalytic domain-containing protein n=1 Tax=Camellia sinensis TaxID=4442 RepID=A0A7J7HSC4_CAMSI|nr:hypothetical protein HYC85_007784 [Camellia sinensis]
MTSEGEGEGEGESFRINLFLNSLSTTRFGRFLIWSPRLSSTHDVVSHFWAAISAEIPIGAVCVADAQFKGRGRSKNVWESPKGCLLFSFTIQMEDGRVVPLVQYVVSLAMTEAIKDVCVKNGIPPLEVRIKWPNDLYLNGLKVGGILCTSVYKSKKFNVSAGKCKVLKSGCGRRNGGGDAVAVAVAVAGCKSRSVMVAAVTVLRTVRTVRSCYSDTPGFQLHTASGRKGGGYMQKRYVTGYVYGIGLNIDNEKPTTCLNAVLKKLTSVAYQLQREDILAAFFNKFENLFDILINKGFQPLEELYYETWLHSGQRVIVQENNADQIVEKVVTIQGLTSSGYLLALGEDNQMCELHPDGNRIRYPRRRLGPTVELETSM